MIPKFRCDLSHKLLADREHIEYYLNKKHYPNVHLDENLYESCTELVHNGDVFIFTEPNFRDSFPLLPTDKFEEILKHAGL